MARSPGTSLRLCEAATQSKTPRSIFVAQAQLAMSGARLKSLG